MRETLAAAGIRLREGPDAEARLAELRAQYEPYLYSLASRLLFPLPPFILTQEMEDAWESTAWDTVGHL